MWLLALHPGVALTLDVLSLWAWVLRRTMLRSGLKGRSKPVPTDLRNPADTVRPPNRHRSERDERSIGSTIAPMKHRG